MVLLTTDDILSLVAGLLFPLTLKMSNCIKVRFILRSIILQRLRVAHIFFLMLSPPYNTEMSI